MNEYEIKQAEERGYGTIKLVLHTAIILHDGWESDNRGWVVELTDGTIKGLTTNHGGICAWDIMGVEDCISTTEKSLVSLNKAKELLLFASQPSKVNEPPYFEEPLVETIRKYNPKFGDNRECKCGHRYYRHFDTYQNMQAVGCKYCECYVFEERYEPKP